MAKMHFCSLYKEICKLLLHFFIKRAKMSVNVDRTLLRFLLKILVAEIYTEK